MRVKHEHGKSCSRCELMLEQAHPAIAEWFLDEVKPLFPSAHISCSYRSKADQDAAFLARKSKLRFPQSKHNATDAQGKPAARALDLFQLSPDGLSARFPKAWYAEIYATSVLDSGAKIRWGGTFKTFGDANHFELV